MKNQTSTLAILTELNFYVEGIIRRLAAKECMPVVIYMGSDDAYTHIFFFSKEEAYKECDWVTEIDTYVGSRQWDAAYDDKINGIVKKLIDDKMLSTIETRGGRSLDIASYEGAIVLDSGIELELVASADEVAYVYLDDIVKINGLTVRFNKE